MLHIYIYIYIYIYDISRLRVNKFGVSPAAAALPNYCNLQLNCRFPEEIRTGKFPSSLRINSGIILNNAIAGMFVSVLYVVSNMS